MFLERLRNDKEACKKKTKQKKNNNNTESRTEKTTSGLLEHDKTCKAKGFSIQIKFIGDQYSLRKCDIYLDWVPRKVIEKKKEKKGKRRKNEIQHNHSIFSYIEEK